MKWGVFFVKKLENVGVFLKVENEGGCKKVDLSSTQVALCTVGPISIFYFTFYLFGGCVRSKRSPLTSGLIKVCVYRLHGH